MKKSVFFMQDGFCMQDGAYSISFEINASSIIWEMIDNEVIVINLQSGHYFHLYKQASIIWLMIDQKFNRDAIVAAFASRYELARAVLTKDIEKFLQELIAEQLISISNGDVTSVKEFEWSNFEKMDYQAPTLDKHTDMTQLLLVDPIHEVDVHGWPNRHPLPQD